MEYNSLNHTGVLGRLITPWGAWHSPSGEQIQLSAAGGGSIPSMERHFIPRLSGSHKGWMMLLDGILCTPLEDMRGTHSTHGKPIHSQNTSFPDLLLPTRVKRCSWTASCALKFLWRTGGWMNPFIHGKAFHSWAKHSQILFLPQGLNDAPGLDPMHPDFPEEQADEPFHPQKTISWTLHSQIYLFPQGLNDAPGLCTPLEDREKNRSIHGKLLNSLNTSFTDLPVPTRVKECPWIASCAFPWRTGGWTIPSVENLLQNTSFPDFTFPGRAKWCSRIASLAPPNFTEGQGMVGWIHDMDLWQLLRSISTLLFLPSMLKINHQNYIKII